jgi:ATP-binding cassette subfamily B protein
VTAPFDVLRSVPLFAELDPAELESLCDAMVERTFSAGETVTAEGAPTDGFFVVASGHADVTVEGQTRRTLNPGDYFGEIALLMGSERTATVVAANELRCYVLTPYDFRVLVEGNPSIAWSVLQSMSHRLA